MNNGYYIGIDLGATNIKIGLVDEYGDIYHRDALPTKKYKTKNQLMDILLSSIRQIKTRCSVRGIGIGAPGLIDSAKGIVHCFINIPDWFDVPLARIIKDKTGIPAFVDNDVNAMALGEFNFGAGRGAKDIICITLGSGVGGGIILNGRIYRGAIGSAGEIGHTTINEDGPRCKCGNRGCVEVYVGNSYIVKEAIHRIRRHKTEDRRQRVSMIGLTKGRLDKITPEIIYKAAKSGDKVALGIWQDAGAHLGAALANAVNLLNPERIIIGGGVANAWRFLYPSIRKTINMRAHKLAARAVKIIRASLGEDAGIIGAGALVREKLRNNQ